ncbi:hypothetical protein ACJX0J_041734, partial [Zea mays]
VHTVKCEPNSIIKAVECLSPQAKEHVKDCGFGGILEIKATKLCSIETIMVIMDKCDVSSNDESFTIVVSNKSRIKSPFTNWRKEYCKFWKELKDKGYNLVTCVKSKGKKQENKKNLFRYKQEQARAFFCIVLCKLLLTTSSNVPTLQHVGMCSYIESTKKYNWCRYICLLETLEPQTMLEETSAGPLIKHYDDKKLKTCYCLYNGAFQIAKHKAKPQPPKVKKLVSGKQKVRTDPTLA